MSGWTVRARESIQKMMESGDVPPLAEETLACCLSWQARSRTPVHQVLSAPRLAPQWVASLLALGATVTVGDEGQETPLFEWLQGDVEGDVTQLHVRVGEDRWGWAHVRRTPADEPIVAAVAAVEMREGIVHTARIALTGTWSKPVGLAAAATSLEGKALDAASIRTVANLVAREVSPKADFRGSEAYRRAMAGVLTGRALQACIEMRHSEDESYE